MLTASTTGFQGMVAIANQVDAQAASGDDRADAAQRVIISVVEELGLRAESATQSVLLLRGRLSSRQDADLPTAQRKDREAQHRRLTEALEAMEAAVYHVDSAASEEETDASLPINREIRRPRTIRRNSR